MQGSGDRNLASRYSLVFNKDVVEIAIEPALSRLCGSNHGMRAQARMFAGVLIWRAIAAESGAAVLAGPEVDPGRSNFDALLTFEPCWLFDRGDNIDVRAILLR